MKIIYKSHIRELSYTFSLSLITLNFLLMMEKILRLSRILSGIGASIRDLITLVLYIQPSLMVLTIPMSLLLSILLTFGRVNADNEMVILRASGLSFPAISRSVFYFGIVTFVLSLFCSFYLSPLSSGRLRDALSRIIIDRAPQSIEAGVFNTSFKDLVILVREKPSPDTMKGIFIYDNRNKKEPKVLVARDGTIKTGRDLSISMFIRDGYIHISRPQAESTEIFFDTYNITLNIATEGPSRKNSELTPLELLKAAEGKEKAERINLLLEFHRRLTLPSLCLILMFLGPPLSLLSGKSGRLGGLTIGIVLFTVFYIIMLYGENMARSGVVSHVVGAWLPVIVFGAVSLIAFMREK
ncbi:MAG: LptF/LptG family permease [Thermodesulfovibrionales bacterium]